MDSNSPRIESDGSHSIPLVSVSHEEGDQHSLATGLVRWDRTEGLSFEISFPGTSASELPRYAPTRSSTGGVGTVSDFIEKANWIGRTVDGSEVKIYSINEVPTSSQTNAWSIEQGASSSSASVIRGGAIYVSVVLPSDSPLAFWNWTAPCTRLALPGTDYHGWVVNEDFEFASAKGITRTSRGITQLSASPLVSLVSFQHNSLEGGGLWIVNQSCPVDDKLWYTEELSHALNFLSLVFGQRLPAFWKDQYLDDSKLRRVYYGCSIWREALNGIEQPIPIANSVESLKHSKDISKLLAPLYAKYLDVSKQYDLDFVLSPIHTAFKTIMDDKLALTCVSLERLATAHAKAMKKNKSGELYVFLTKEQSSELAAELAKAIATVASNHQISEDRLAILNKKIGSIAQPPNADKLKQIWVDLGIELSEEEFQVIKNRNQALHGSPTLVYTDGSNNSNDEAKRFDVLRSLIHKAILRLLNYEGPYVAYGERPLKGNYPIRLMTTRKQETNPKFSLDDSESD